jgi:hypothetical protein
VVGDWLEAAAVVAGTAVLNSELPGAAVVVAPNFSVGAADCAVAAGCAADVLAAGWLKRLVVVVTCCEEGVLAAG